MTPQGKIVLLYVLFSVVLGAALFATGEIPRVFHIPAVVHMGPRPAGTPSLVSTAALRTLLTGRYYITNVIHGGPSSRSPYSSVMRDQLRRLMWAVLFLVLCVKTEANLSVRWVRTPLILAFLLGAASMVSDVASFYLHRGVVDWIGVSGADGKLRLSIFFSPADVFFVLALAACLALAAIALCKKLVRLKEEYGKPPGISLNLR